MDDVVIERSAPTPIPILSPALHCVAMTALVYLRTSFGYTFLRPKSIFLALSWAFALFVFMAWNEPGVWREYRAVCLFGTGAVLLYLTQLLLTFSREWRKQAEEDHYPGTSHTEFLSRRFGFRAVSERTLHFWVEPGVVLIASIALRVVARERHLSAWLFFVAICMVGREAINHWTSVRRGKIAGETMKKVKEQGDSLFENQHAPEPPKPTRTEPERRRRNTAFAEEAAREERFAKLLRLRPPYTLATAEEHYKTLVQLEHPDTHGNSPASNAATAELNDAIAFFRDRLGDTHQVPPKRPAKT